MFISGRRLFLRNYESDQVWHGLPYMQSTADYPEQNDHKVEYAAVYDSAKTYPTAAGY